jgi:hypothetical protein
VTNSVLEAKVTTNTPLVRPQSIGLQHDELSALSALINNWIELLYHRSSIVEIVSRTVACVSQFVVSRTVACLSQIVRHNFCRFLCGYCFFFDVAKLRTRGVIVCTYLTICFNASAAYRGGIVEILGKMAQQLS